MNVTTPHIKSLIINSQQHNSIKLCNWKISNNVYFQCRLKKVYVKMRRSVPLRRLLRHWYVASSITLCCIRVQPSILHCFRLSTLHFCLVDSLLRYAPDFIFNWIEVGAIKNLKMNTGVSRSRGWSSLAPMCWDTVLLKDEELARDLTYGRQQLLWL